MKYILSLDLGTTANRAILFDKKGKIVSIARKAFKQYYPQPGWFEQDPWEIWKSAKDVIDRVAGKSGIAAIGITNQRETTVIWDSRTGQPVYNAIVWQDRRTTNVCQRLGKYNQVVANKTGLRIEPYFSATKINWILSQVKADKKYLKFGTIDSWILWNLTSGKVHATDVSNASRTLLFNARTLRWDDQLCKIFKVPKHILPKVFPSSHNFGLMDNGIPITGIIGDQQAALFGQGCFKAGEIKTTYGTGAFVMLNTESKFVKPKNGILSTIAWKIGNKVVYAMEGSVFSCGAALNWLQNNLQFANSPAALGEMAKSVPDTGGVSVVPAFSGWGAPYWNSQARAGIFGLSFYSRKEHIVRAVFEGISHQVTDVISAMRKASGLPLVSMRVDGGVSQSSLMLQHQADMAEMKIFKALESESTALGAAMMAGIKVGFWKNLHRLVKTSQVFQPKISSKARVLERKKWKSLVELVG